MARIEDHLDARLVSQKVSSRMVTLVATQSYAYAQRSLVAGDTFEASEKDAALLKLIGKATDPPAETKHTRPKRTYQRRDLTPEE